MNDMQAQLAAPWPGDFDGQVRDAWRIRPGTTYLNHGSWGPPPLCVREARANWQARLDEQPMDAFLRQYEESWLRARASLAAFVGADADGVVFVPNATAGMNLVADSTKLGVGDEILLNDHEYGAVARIWNRKALESGAEVRTLILPTPFDDPAELVEFFKQSFSAKTRMLVLSHITSPTAITLPIQEIAAAAKERGILVCIDGPHAVAQLPLDVISLDVDFYTASCHKWLCAPLGSGFLYVDPAHRKRIRPACLSWGRLRPNEPKEWYEEFIWSGTADYAAYLAIPVAIDFLETIGIERFRTQTHAMARYVRKKLESLGGGAPLVSDSQVWYGSMAHVPIPFAGDAAALQRKLWDEYRIEAPIWNFGERVFARVSCHAYTTQEQVDYFLEALKSELRVKAAAQQRK
jgi:isopenicillin-N epimerase